MIYTGPNQAVSDMDSHSTHDMRGPLRSVVRGFSRYSETVNSLPILERNKLVFVSNFVMESFLPGRLPILGIRLIGHADTDPQRERREPGYLQKISLKRANEIERYLWLTISFNTRPITVLINPPVRVGPTPQDIRLRSSGVGASQPDEENVRRGKTHANMTEQDRKLNRRVEIFLEPGATPVPQPTEPRAKIGMTVLEVLEFLEKNRPPKPFPWDLKVPPCPVDPKAPPRGTFPWNPKFPPWNPKFPPLLEKDEWKRFKKMVKERLKYFDIDTVLSALKDMIVSDPSQTSDWTNSLRQMVDEIEKRRREGQKEWWKDDD